MQKYELIFILKADQPEAEMQARVDRVVQALETLDAELTPQQPEGRALVEGYTINYGTNADTPETGAHLATVSARLLPAGVRATDVTEILDRWKTTGEDRGDVYVLLGGRRKYDDGYVTLSSSGFAMK